MQRALQLRTARMVPNSAQMPNLLSHRNWDTKPMTHVCNNKTYQYDPNNGLWFQLMENGETFGIGYHFDEISTPGFRYVPDKDY